MFNQMPVIETMQDDVRALITIANATHQQVQNADSKKYWSNVMAKLVAVQQALDAK